LSLSLELDEKVRPDLFGSSKAEIEGEEKAAGDIVSELWAF
jgi:hypothetical protein